MITLKSNTANLVARVFMLILCATIVSLAITTDIIKKNKQAEKVLYACLVLTMIFALILIIISFLGIIKVDIDQSASLITLFGFFSTRIINSHDIVGYYNSFSVSRRRTFYGIILLLDNHASFEIIEYNLKTIAGLEQYLKDSNVRCLGKVKSRFPFRSKVAKANDL